MDYVIAGNYDQFNRWRMESVHFIERLHSPWVMYVGSADDIRGMQRQEGDRAVFTGTWWERRDRELAQILVQLLVIGFDPEEVYPYSRQRQLIVQSARSVGRSANAYQTITIGRSPEAQFNSVVEALGADWADEYRTVDWSPDLAGGMTMAELLDMTEEFGAHRRLMSVDVGEQPDDQCDDQQHTDDRPNSIRS